MKIYKSPYSGINKSNWLNITEKLIEKHPFKKEEIVQVVLQSWQDIFSSNIGKYKIGKEIFPAPQIISFLLHELIAYNFRDLYTGKFRVGLAKDEKDIHCEYDVQNSVEIKASSHPSQIFANRSYAQPATGDQRKSKNGYFIAINFQKVTKKEKEPKILKVRFGYLEHSDWIAQTAATGQQARLDPETYRLKFVELYGE